MSECNGLWAKVWVGGSVPWGTEIWGGGRAHTWSSGAEKLVQWSVPNDSGHLTQIKLEKHWSCMNTLTNS